MKKLFKPAIITVSAFLFFSTGCQSSNVLRIPGESEIITKNIASEYFTIAEGYADLKKYDKAAEYYKLAMKNKELKLSAYYKMARCYALAKNYSEAQNAYEALLKLDPENKDLQLSLAYIYGMNGETKKATEEYSKLCQAFPNDSDVMANYINLLISAEKWEEAGEQFKIFKEKFPDNSNISNWEDKIGSKIDLEGDDSKKEGEPATIQPPPEKI